MEEAKRRELTGLKEGDMRKAGRQGERQAGRKVREGPGEFWARALMTGPVFRELSTLKSDSHT